MIGLVMKPPENNHPAGLLCGLDEAGRGALAGPLVAAAVIMSAGEQKTVIKLIPFRLRDGKLLSPEQRLTVFEILKQAGVRYRTETVSARKINNHGISKANIRIFRTLIRQVESDTYIADGNLRLGKISGKTGRIRSIVRADAMIPAVMLAGIVAKVTRDSIMSGLHHKYPRYLWHKNHGYGTAEHILAIMIYGTTPQHRNRFVHTAIRNKNNLLYS